MSKTVTNHIQKFNEATSYIEEKIKNSEEITNEIISKKLGYEQHYFSKIFQKYANMTIQEYIKRRKMSYALIDLIKENSNVSDIAAKYLYSSDGFTKAFKDVFGVNPIKIKKHSTQKEEDSNIWNVFTNRIIMNDYSEYIDEPIILKVFDGEEMKFVGIWDLADQKSYEDFSIVSEIYENGKSFNLDYYDKGEYSPPDSYYAYYYTPFVGKTDDSDIIIIPRRKWLALYAKGIDRGITLSALSTYARYEWAKKQNEYSIDDGYEIGFVSENFNNLGIDEEDGYELWIPIKEK